MASPIKKRKNGFDPHEALGIIDPMKSLSDYSLVELRWVIALREKIEALQGELDAITGEVAVTTDNEAPTTAKRKYHMTAAHKRKLIKRLARARKIRGAKVRRAKKGTSRLLSAGSHYQDKGLYRPRKEISKKPLSAAGTSAIAAGARVRPPRKDRRRSPATRAKLSAAATVRWAKVRAEGKTRL